MAVIALAACGESPAPSNAQPTTTTSSTTTGLPPVTTTTRDPGSVPAQVTVVRAGPAGGSGEIMVTWGGVALATGYRVSRATSPDGPFSTTADLDVATGSSTKASGVTNVFVASDGSYVYVEVLSDAATTGPRRYYRVTAYNAAGDAAPSMVVCGTPPGLPTC